MMVYRNESSYPEFVRLLKRNWGADTTGMREDTVTPGELLGAIKSQSAMVQQLVEELASFMGKSQDFSLSVPMSIVLDGSRQGDTIDGVPDDECGEGYTSLLVNNIGSTYDATTGIVSNGHAAIFKGVVSFDTVCMENLVLPGKPDISHAVAIAFQLPASGWGAGCTVLDYYNGEDPDPLAAGVTVYDPNNLFPRYITNAKGKAVWNPAGGPTGLVSPTFDSTAHWVAVECEESDPPSTSSGYTAGCGIDITGLAISVNRSQIITSTSGGPIIAGPGTCDLDLNVGCGLIVSGGVLQVDSTDLVGDGLKLTTTSDCQIEISYGCGLKIDPTTKQLMVRADKLVGDGLVTDSYSSCALGVNYGCGLTLNAGKIEFDPTKVAGTGLTANTAGGYCKLDVVPGTIGTASHIMFKLKYDLSAGVIGTASATVEDFWDGNDPGTSVIVYDYHRDTTGYGPFIQAKGPRTGVREGAVGMATWDNDDAEYKVVTCQTLAKKILFELDSDMTSLYQASCKITDYYDGQNPGTNLSTIFDEAHLFRRALTSATGYAILDDKVYGSAGYDGKYLIIECNQMASAFEGRTTATYQCTTTDMMTNTDIKFTQVMSKAPHSQVPPVDQYGNISCRNMFDRFINIAGKACHCVWNESREAYDLVEVKNTELISVTGNFTVNTGTKSLTWDAIELCVPVPTISSASYTGVDCTSTP